MTRFSTGRFEPDHPDKYIGKKTPKWRSSWELAFMRFLDNHPNVTQWASESLSIPYKNPFTGKSTIYVPDFFVAYTDADGKQHAELIEVKPQNQTIKEHVGKSKANQAAWVLNQVKWQAAQAFCKQRGITFRVVNEQDIFHNGKRR